MKLPAKSTQANLPQSLKDKIGRLRAATGKPERCDRLIFCSSDPAMPSSVYSFERMHPDEQFRLIDRGDAGGSVAGSITATTFREDEFAPFATRCERCGNDRRIKCLDCDRFYCQGSVYQEGGAKFFYCPTCKSDGRLTSGGKSGSVTAIKSNAPASAPAGLLGHVSQRLLPGRK